MNQIYVGTAGWQVPKFISDLFSTDGSHLERYSQSLSCVEINSSFYREHKPETYSRWADSTPSQFRFSVKLSKEITHTKALNISSQKLSEVLKGPLCLGEKFGCLLIQLAPKHAYDVKSAHSFFSKLRDLYYGPIALEPRHQSWISQDFLDKFGLSIVYADPSRVEPSRESELAGGIFYARLHGSPEIYRSAYASEQIQRWAKRAASLGAESWWIFDNTTFGFATSNALEFKNLV